MSLNLANTRQRLQDFDFRRLFIEELGWSTPPSTLKPIDAEAKGGLRFRRTLVAVLSGVHVFEITTPDGAIPDAKGRAAVHAVVFTIAAENLLIFTDAARTQSLWYWVKRESGKSRPRDHYYLKGQPGDLFLSKLAALVVDISELDAAGNISLLKVARRLKEALDVERVTKDFFGDFQKEHLDFLSHIEGIPDARERRWYASVLLNRLMFVWFLQKKGFLDVGKNSTGDHDYLSRKFASSIAGKKGRFFSHFLRDLFFEGFAKPEKDRTIVGTLELGDIPYLNGGLFLPHGIESRIEGVALATEPYKKIRIPDEAFEGLFQLFARYSWSLNDTPGGNDKEINPDVLGYIFEKYINQKEFGAYYTRPEITEYLCEQTIHQLLLDAAAKWTSTATQLHAAGVTEGTAPRTYSTIGDLLLHSDGPLCQHLLQHVIPRLSLLDPACGSGAFLVAALKTLLSLTTGLIGRCHALSHRPVLQWIEHEQGMHRAPQAYWLKKKLITENLYGVDLMEEAVEIAKLRLFLTLVASAEARDQLEPLPNIEFNLLAGNSLIGLLHVDPADFDLGRSTKGEQIRSTLTHETELGLTVESATAPTKKETVAAYLAKERAAKYTSLLGEKNRLVTLYRNSSSITQDLAALRSEIDKHNSSARDVLDRQLLREFQGLGIMFSQAIWDKNEHAEGKAEKRKLTLDDIRALRPFHWAYEFDEIVVDRGGFDAIVTNPPWEVFQTNEKEFFQEYAPTIQRKKLQIENWEKQRDKLLRDPDIQQDWLTYISRFPHQWGYFKHSRQFANQTSLVAGKSVGNKPNLYCLFTEQCFNLIRPAGYCGIVVPSGLYTDLGAKQLREMLFAQSQITGLFCFENRDEIFEGVHRSFKFIVLSFEKGGTSEHFPAAFMRHHVTELTRFPHEGAVNISVELVRRISPDSLSVMEFKEQLDVAIAEKMSVHPLLYGHPTGWNLELYGEELNMTRSADSFQTRPTKSPVYEGGMIWQFDHVYSEPRYWVKETELRPSFLTKKLKRIDGLEKAPKDLVNDYEVIRIAVRKIASNTNERTLIAALIPPYAFAGNSLSVHFPFFHENSNYKTLRYSAADLFVLVAELNSFVVDYILRSRMTTNLNLFYLYQLPIPRPPPSFPAYRALAERAARLIGTTEEYSGLLREVFGAKATHHTHGERSAEGRARLRAEIDGLVAHLYSLTEPEFSHILNAFPLVADPIKAAALNAFRELLPHPDDITLAKIIASGENHIVEFKAAAVWNSFKQAKDDSMRRNIAETVAGFMNAEGGTLLVGVTDNGQIAGLDEDFMAANPKKANSDGYELFLRDFLRNSLGGENAKYLSISFHTVADKPVCRVLVKAAPQPVYYDGRLFVRTGNQTPELNAQEATAYQMRHWRQS